MNILRDFRPLPYLLGNRLFLSNTKVCWFYITTPPVSCQVRALAPAMRAEDKFLDVRPLRTGQDGSLGRIFGSQPRSKRRTVVIDWPLKWFDWVSTSGKIDPVWVPNGRPGRTCIHSPKGQTTAPERRAGNSALLSDGNL